MKERHLDILILILFVALGGVAGRYCYKAIMATAVCNTEPIGKKSLIVQSPIVKENLTVETPLDDLLDAIEECELGGNLFAIGDNGKAVGAYQLWKVYVRDTNRILELQGSDKQFTYNDRLDRDKSRAMTSIVIQYYGKGNIEHMARVHNAGGDGWRNDAGWFVRNRNYTLAKAERKIANAKAYWSKIKEILEKK